MAPPVAEKVERGTADLKAALQNGTAPHKPLPENLPQSVPNPGQACGHMTIAFPQIRFASVPY